MPLFIRQLIPEFGEFELDQFSSRVPSFQSRDLLPKLGDGGLGFRFHLNAHYQQLVTQQAFFLQVRKIAVSLMMNIKRAAWDFSPSSAPSSWSDSPDRN